MTIALDTADAKRERRVHLAARVEEQAFVQLAELARRNDRSLSAEVRRALRWHLEREQGSKVV